MRLPLRAELSEEQEDFLLEAPYDSPVLCIGPPGTGKTVLALYRASVIEQNNQDIEFIMFSKLLNRYIHRSVEELDLNINSRTWNSWIGWKWARSNNGGRIPQISPFNPDFIEAIGLINNDQVVDPSKLYWEQLVIDEGQDFPQEFYMFLSFIMNESRITNNRKGQGTTIFADDNQQMEVGRNSSIDDIIAATPNIDQYSLSKNYRNSAPIARLASNFYVGHKTGIPDIPDTEGPTPQLKQFQNIEQEIDSIVTWINNNDDLSAGVFVPTVRLQNKIYPLIQKKVNSGIRLQKYNSKTDPKEINFHQEGSLTLLCDKSCKGLEFDAVFIPQLQSHRFEDAADEIFLMKMYVMVSRARSFLQISYSDCVEPPAVLEALPSQDEEVILWKI